MKLSIGQVSKLFNISKDTLRYYDKIGVLTPEVNKDNGYRFYELKHLEKLGLILGIKYLGISLSEIKDTIESEDINEYKKLVARQEKIIDQKIKELNELRKVIKEGKNTIDNIINFENEYDFSKLETIEENYTLYGFNIKNILISDYYKISEKSLDEESNILDEEYFIYLCNVVQNKHLEEDEELIFIKECDSNMKFIEKFIGDSSEFIKKTIKGNVISVDFYGSESEIEDYIISLNKYFKCNENNEVYLKYDFYLPKKEDSVMYFVNINLLA